METQRFFAPICGIFVLACLLLTACEEEEKLQARKDIPLTRTELNMVEANNEFTFSLFNNLVEISQGSNLMISPFSLSEVLGMLANGAAGETKEEIIKALGFENYSIEEVNTYYKTLRKGLLEVDNSTQLSLANSVWIEENFSIETAFKETLESEYKASVNVLPFNNSMVEKVNSWCHHQTNGRITQFLTETPREELLLLNALYFKGQWKEKFDPKETKEKIFFKEAGTTRSHYMCQDLKALCYSVEEENFKLLQLPYGNQAFNMTIALPDKEISVDELVESLSAEKWASCIQQMKNYNVHVELPLFTAEFEYTDKLKSALQKMGVSTLFESANLSGISSKKGLNISGFKQKTYIEVTEEGTTAAAVSGNGMDMSPSSLAAQEFIVNRPFVYVIQEISTGAILFIGKVMES